MKRWWRWRCEIRQTRCELERVRAAWTAAEYAYHDLAEIYRDQPGEFWTAAGPVGKAQAEAGQLTDRFYELHDKLRRLEQLGPR